MTTADDPLSEPRAFWDAEAAGFDDEPDHGLRDPAVRERWRTLLLAHLPVAPADVVDLGCGTGTLSLLLADQGFAVRGTDLSPAMIARARAKAAAAGADVPFSVGDAADPPYQPASADVVMCRHVLWALPDPVGALRRWADLLRPEGRMLLVEGRWHTGGGLTAAETTDLVRRVRDRVEVVPLSDSGYWGRPIADERYLVVGLS